MAHLKFSTPDMQWPILLSLMVLKVYVVTLKITPLKSLSHFTFHFLLGGWKTMGLSAIASADMSEP